MRCHDVLVSHLPQNQTLVLASEPMCLSQQVTSNTTKRSLPYWLSKSSICSQWRMFCLSAWLPGVTSLSMPWCPFCYNWFLTSVSITSLQW